MQFILTVALGYESLKFPPVSVCRVDGSVFETYINWNNVPNKDFLTYVKADILHYHQTKVFAAVVCGKEAEDRPTFTDLTGWQ